MNSAIEEPAQTRSDLRRRVVTAACMCSAFMVAIEVTIVGTAMPTIVGQLGDFNLFTWVFAAYILTSAVTAPIYGRLADLYGRKRSLLCRRWHVSVRLADVRLCRRTCCG